MLEKYAGPLVVAFIALLATASTLAPAGNGPGVTCDELYHTALGKSQVTALRQQGFAFFQPQNIDQNYPWKPGGPPVQAPLGYWILGLAHHLFDPAPDNPGSLSIAAARFAPAGAFALLVFLIGAWTVRREGTLAGTAAAVAVLFMPRLFGHAHLAALDMLTTLFFVAAVLAVAEAARGGRYWPFALAGVVWGAAVLVRLHGLLLAPPVVLWLVFRLFHTENWRKSIGRGFLQIGAWTAAGAATVFVGWPWLWLDPFERFRLYLSSGTARQPINVFYAGQVWADRDVPWHYPWVMFLATVPVGLLLLGAWGLWVKFREKYLAEKNYWPGFFMNSGHSERSEESGLVRMQRRSFATLRMTFRNNPGWNIFGGETALLAGAMLFVLMVFSWPGVPVYDGGRLFLMAFPFWAILAGVGAAAIARRGNNVMKNSRRLTASGKSNHKSSIFRRLLASGYWSKYKLVALAFLSFPRSAWERIWPDALRPPRCRATPPASDAERLSGCVPTQSVGTRAAVFMFLVLQGVGLVLYFPYHLSYYNLLVGGLAGAERMGFEPTYWGDTVREPMLAELASRAEHEPVLFLPNLAPFQAPGVRISSPSLQDAQIDLIGLDSTQSLSPCRYVLVYHRRADLAQAAEYLKHGKVVAESSYQGVWLARLLELEGVFRK